VLNQKHSMETLSHPLVSMEAPNPCSSCVELCNFLFKRGRELILMQLHTKDGDEHLYLAHGYCTDDDLETTHWHHAIIQE
jgi:hypothetical protein